MLQSLSEKASDLAGSIEDLSERSLDGKSSATICHVCHIKDTVTSLEDAILLMYKYLEGRRPIDP